MKLTVVKRKIKTVFRRPKTILEKLLYFTSPIFSDSLYLKILFPLKVGYKLNLDNPRTYNEKLQWLKINYRKPVMSQMVDKYAVKEFAKDIINDEHIIGNYGVWDSFDEIQFDKLPDQFVLKTTHDQGGVVVVTDKKKFNKKMARRKLSKHLNKNHYYLTREWPYKNVKPRIFAEKFLNSDVPGDLFDYKFYCFHGVPKIMYMSHGRASNVCYFDYFDMEFNRHNISAPGASQSKGEFTLPENWELMKSLAVKLSEGFPHLRVDFYNIGGEVYLGELTFFSGGGMKPLYPRDWNSTLGDWINLEVVKKDIGWY